MDVQSFSRRMIELLPKCTRGFQDYEYNYLSRGQISLPQFWAMEYLSRNGDCAMSELADFLHISRPAATGLIDRLIGQKFVQRASAASDRRSVLVSITPRGRKIVSHVWDQKRRSLEKVFANISAQERRQYLIILEKVVANLSVPKLILAGLLLLGAGINQLRADESPLTQLTLRQAYQLALKRSESLAIQQQLIEEAKGRFSQALSHSLPKVTFEDTEKFQDRYSSSSSENATRSYVPTRAFVFTQPLFSGFKEFSSLGVAKAERRQREQEYRRAEQVLFTDVSDAFYLYQSYQQELQAMQLTDDALKQRQDEIKRRQGLGRSRLSEVSNTESRYYQNLAEMESVRSEAQVSRELLEFIVGAPVSSLADETVVVQLSDRDAYLSRAKQRPDVLAAEQAHLAAQKNITVARAGYFPSVDVVGTSYVKRVGPISRSNWDITLNISVPLFNASSVAGDVKVARAQAEQAKLLLSQTLRRANLDIDNAYTRAASGVRETQAYQKAADAAQRNYELQKQDYSNSLVNNLDVMQAVEDLQDVRRNYISVKNEAQRAYWALKVATGDLHDSL